MKDGTIDDRRKARKNIIKNKQRVQTEAQGIQSGEERSGDEKKKAQENEGPREKRREETRQRPLVKKNAKKNTVRNAPLIFATMTRNRITFVLALVVYIAFATVVLAVLFGWDTADRQQRRGGFQTCQMGGSAMVTEVMGRR